MKKMNISIFHINRFRILILLYSTAVQHNSTAVVLELGLGFLYIDDYDSTVGSYLYIYTAVYNIISEISEISQFKLLIL
jgi:hypothetical protein